MLFKIVFFVKGTGIRKARFLPIRQERTEKYFQYPVALQNRCNLIMETKIICLFIFHHRFIAFSGENTLMDSRKRLYLLEFWCEGNDLSEMGARVRSYVTVAEVIDVNKNHHELNKMWCQKSKIANERWRVTWQGERGRKPSWDGFARQMSICTCALFRGCCDCTIIQLFFNCSRILSLLFNQV